ncbi:MAG: hypothetical protein JWO82_376 [Akkermansiaceae bacterium]|nr:hypothetical protein [Akkermansiaceae bacterium]
MKRSTPASLALIGLGLLIPAVASRVARRLAGGGFQAITRRAPPRNPAAPGVKWQHAILWTALSGALGGLASMVARKGLTRAGIPAEGYDLGAKVRSLVLRRRA